MVFQAPALSARTSNGNRYPVKVVGYDDQNDLAVIRVSVPKGTPFLPLASSTPKLGDAALAIGNGGGEYLRPKVGRFTALRSEAGRADFPRHPGTQRPAGARRQWRAYHQPRGRGGRGGELRALREHRGA
ncbi:trypsin-like peptidase domain-containing protein [Deinococcus sp. PESE-38]